jgi:hypothetical protein
LARPDAQRGIRRQRRASGGGEVARRSAIPRTAMIAARRRGGGQAPGRARDERSCSGPRDTDTRAGAAKGLARSSRRTPAARPTLRSRPSSGRQIGRRMPCPHWSTRPCTLDALRLAAGPASTSAHRKPERVAVCPNRASNRAAQALPPRSRRENAPTGIAQGTFSRRGPAYTVGRRTRSHRPRQASASAVRHTVGPACAGGPRTPDCPTLGPAGDERPLQSHCP